jgi:hypothetical protein
MCAVLYATTTPLARADEEAIRLKDGAGRELTRARCVICHSLDYIPMNAAVMSRAEWEKSIRKMIDRFGAPVTEDEAHQILDYLAQQYSR